jgi:tetratricopeptide (TPR) repeat protein
VSGLPLGIELAASWVEHLTVAEIGHALAEIAVEPAQAASHVDRHQTLHAVFEYSWRLLSPHQQQILARLSAFRGGFDRAAASAVAESNLSDLSLLLAHSLVQRVTAGRYDLHPLVQEFAARKLGTTNAASLFRAHSHHYLSLLTNAEPTKRTALRVDFENVRSAWQRAVLATDGTLIQQSTIPFGEFMEQFGSMTDGNQLFAAAVATFDTLPQPGVAQPARPHQAELVAQLLDQQSSFVRSLYGLRAASPLQQRVLSLTQEPLLQARAHDDLANYHAEQGEWAQADFHFDQAETIAQAVADLSLYFHTVEARIHINAIHFRGDFAQGIARLEALLRMLDGATDTISDAENFRSFLLNSLSLVAIRWRDYALAMRYAKAGLALAQQMRHRQRQCQSLLDLALAEQFAGLFAEAVTHNRAALTLAEAIGEADLMALLQANLCLTLRQQGALTAALDDGQIAVTTLRALGNRRIEGQARNRVGHTLLALERWGEAETAYAEALIVWEPTHHPNRYEAVAGQAVALLHLGRQAEALPLVEAVLNFVAEHDLVGIVEPVLLLLNCATVLTASAEPAQAAAVLQQADGWVQTVADRISDERVRGVFLARPDNQLLQARLASAR